MNVAIYGAAVCTEPRQAVVKLLHANILIYKACAFPTKH